MTDTIFRSQQTPVQPTEFKETKGPITPVSNAEVPYLDYEHEHAKPYSVDHFELGDSWNDPTGGFPSEVQTIENYFKAKIESGEMENSKLAVEKRLKEIEKVANMHKDGRKTIRLGTVANYIEFLMKTEDIHNNIKKYGNTK